MKYINKTTKEIYNTPGDVRKAVQPKRLPKIITQAVLDANGLAYFYEGIKPVASIFEVVKPEGIKVDSQGKFVQDYVLEEVFTTVEEKQTVLDSNLEQAKKVKVKELQRTLEDYLDKILDECPLYETISWDKQESEARSFLADSNAVTPYIDTLIVSRDKGETKEELVNKIVSNADAYTALHANALGEYQSKLVQVNEFTATVDTVTKDLEKLSGISLELPEDETEVK